MNEVKALAVSIFLCALGPLLADIRATEGAAGFSHALIPPITPACENHDTTVKNGVKFDVFFDRGIKSNVAIYAINTGRKQLVLTPARHRAILEDLIRKRFTVVVADFRDRKFQGLELEHYVVQLAADAREAVDGVLPRASGARPATSRTETYANDYLPLMPGFTVQRDVTWFRYGDIPEPFRREIARQVGKPFREEDANVVNTYDIIYPPYGPDVPVLTNYGSNEKGREDYFPRAGTFMVMAFAFKNVAIVHQQYFNDPVGGYHKGYDFYGDQFATCFIRHLKGNAGRYHLDPQRICCFGHSKGSEVPGMLVNRLRDAPPYRHAKAEWKRTGLDAAALTIPSAFPSQSTEIACAILGAGIANRELGSDQLMPWDNEPTKNIAPFFLYADHRADTRQATSNTMARARAKGLDAETAEMAAHTWPIGPVYESASAFIDRVLRLDY